MTPTAEKPTRPLSNFFAPSSVAVFGATETPNSVGRTIMENLASFPGPVYPVNLKRPAVLGRKAFPNAKSLPEPPDLAIIATPADSVPAVVAECSALGVTAAIVISAGFKEAGAHGVDLEKQVLAARGKMRIIGPNCLGLMAPLAGLNATFAAGNARQGSIALLSQSGALCTAILDWSISERVGFSAFVSTGSMLDVGWGDLIDYLGDDPATKAILLYMESVGDARSFLSAAREVALTKPIILIKAGRTSQAAKAAASHTGALTGSDAVLDAALRRAGVLRVKRISDLFYMAETLARQPRPAGPKLVIVTNAGGPGVLATDSLVELGGELAELSKETITALDGVLPAHWSRSNPVDILGDAPPERYAKALEIVAKDPAADGILVSLSPQGMTDPTAAAEGLAPYAKLGKPVIASWMGGNNVEGGRDALNQIGIPNFPFPDTAARVFTYMWQYTSSLRALYETPEWEEAAIDRAAAAAILEGARAEGRTLLTEAESKKLIAAYGIPVPRIEVAPTVDEALAFSGSIGYPVVLKLHSRTVTHKTDVGGVELNLRSEADVRAAFERIRAGVTAKAGETAFEGVTVQPMVKIKDAYELILGSSADPQFGPVLLFGSGGQLVEVYEDSALGLPPLNSVLARRLMERTKINKALDGVRGRKPVNRAELEQIVVRFSQLIAEQRRIKEADINPLLAGPEAIMALDGRIVLHDWSVRDEDLPRTAIRAYPRRYVKHWETRNGVPVTMRPIRPEDEPALAEFHRTLSERSVYMRYFYQLSLSQRVSHERLTRICHSDYAREMVLVVEAADGAILAVGRLTRQHGANSTEFALLVGDPWQDSGLGTELLTTLLEIAREEKIARVTGNILPDNRPMLEICKALGFTLEFDRDEGVVIAAIDI